MSSIKTEIQALNFNDEWSFSQEQYEPYSHNYHRYPAKFISPLARKIIESESNVGDLICDPFGGCGTTLLESKIRGRRSLGFDINPVAKLITEVKTKALLPEKLEESKEKLFASIHFESALINDYGTTHERMRYWFDKDTYLALNHVYDCILKEQNADIQKFFLCAFSHCLKNCSRWLMKSIKPTIDKEKAPVNVRKVFTRHVTAMVKKNSLLYEYLKDRKQLSLYSKIYLKDITKLRQDIQVNLVDLIITSPPYVTSYEYGDLHQLTILWLGQKKYKHWENCWLITEDLKANLSVAIFKEKLRTI